MRKWYLLFIMMLIAAMIAALGGCEGEEGPQGPQGDKGITGPDGTDPITAAPEPCWLSLGITNATLDAAAGAKHIYVTFDSTMQGAPDTVVGNYVENAPLIDGFDGEEGEYGAQFSKIGLSFFNPNADPDLQDPNMYEALCRVAYDEHYIYTMLQWKEISIAVKDSAGQDVFLVLASLSNEMGELKYSRLPDTIYNVITEQWDTTFEYFRVDTGMMIIDTIYFPPPFDDVIDRIDTTLEVDTTRVWTSLGKGEDRAGLIWNPADRPTWNDAAFDLLFRQDGYQPTIPADLELDVWMWGAATSDPTFTADDWYIDASGARPDAGSGPYIDNLILPDSVPRYQNRLDPNIRTSATPAAQIYPLWYFDAVGFRHVNWAINRPVYVPGLVTVLPTLGRADVYAASSFDNGLWTLEMRRARNSHSGDDLVF